MRVFVRTNLRVRADAALLRAPDQSYRISRNFIIAGRLSAESQRFDSDSVTRGIIQIRNRVNACDAFDPARPRTLTCPTCVLSDRR
jgi:hypothetical protein